MSDDNNVVVEATEEVKQTDKAKAMRRRSSIGRFFDGVKSLLGFSTGQIIDDDDDEKEGDETEVKAEVAAHEDKMDVDDEVADEDEDPEDSLDDADEDFFLAEGEEVKPDPKLQAIKKMNLPKKEKVALAKQRSEELLEEAIRRASQEEESRSASPERKTTKKRGRPPKKTTAKKAAAKTAAKKTPKSAAKSAAKSPARSRSSSPAKSPSRSRSASPAKKAPTKKAATKTPKKTTAKSPAKTPKTPKSPAKSPAKSPNTPRSTRKTPAKPKAAAAKAAPSTVGRKRKAEDPAEGESPTKKLKVGRRKSAPAKKQESLPDVTVTWPKSVLRQTYKGGKTFYGSVTVNNKKFSIGDTIYLISEDSTEPYIGIIESLYETKTGRNRAELQWYYKHEETNSTAKPVKGEVYQSDHIDANPIESFVLNRTPVVKHEQEIKDLSAYLSKPDNYYYNRFYDHEAKKFRNAKFEK